MYMRGVSLWHVVREKGNLSPIHARNVNWPCRITTGPILLVRMGHELKKADP